MAEEDAAEDDFTFPATIANPPPCLLESPPLWPAVERSGECDDRWSLEFFQEFSRKNITFRENFCYVDDDRDDDCKEEKMDILWEDLNEKLTRNCSNNKNIGGGGGEDYSDNSSSSPGRNEDHVQVCCVKTLKLSKANGQTISWKKASILVLIRFLFKKSFPMHESSSSINKLQW